MHPPSALAARLARVGLLAAAAVGLVGCGLMEAPASPATSGRVRSSPPVIVSPDASDEVPTLRPVPSGAVDLIGAADALADLDSYRVSVLSQGLVPSSARDGRVTMTSTLIQGDRPAAAFTMTGVDGLEGLGDGPLHAIVIGDEAWLRSGTGRWAKSPGGAADFDAAFTTLSPTELVAGFEALAPAFVKVGPETKNGQATTHYRVDAADPVAIEAGLTAGGADVWLGRDAGELIAILVDGTVDVDGTVTPVVLQIDVNHIDDPTNRVRPPA
ncbi:MAG TPA: hypothetical protein VFY18_07980 [Candidatus Limnocylindrales bacterium]|nr:hypothetical protein [Candidatus Limnocylindrales bacterium]